MTPKNQLLHRLWTKAVGTEGYNKKQWQALEFVVSNGRLPAYGEVPSEVVDAARPRQPGEPL